MGEGEPYIGIKPAGTGVDPGILAADMVVETGNIDEMTKNISTKINETIKRQFNEVMEMKKDKDVESGRRYVESYVKFIHYIEKVYSLVLDN